jgi:prevent-host-death family protein
MEHVFNMHDAKSQLSRLIALAEKGEVVVIARDGKPIARLVPVATPTQSRFGAWKDRLPDLGPEAFAPMSEEEAAEWGQ